MRVLIASSELHPYSKTGGLADMVSALGKYLAAEGHDVVMVTPLYAGLREKLTGLTRLGFSGTVVLGEATLPVVLQEWVVSDGLRVWFVDAPAFFERPALYGDSQGDYADNAARFLYFGKCVVQAARAMPQAPDVVHTHDWQTGAVSLLLRHERTMGGWAEAPPVCYTIHNLAYQGVFPPEAFRLLNLPWHYFSAEGIEFFGQINLMKAGLVYSDGLTTVSPRYAREITTPEFGCGLDGVLRARQSVLRGILNGVDYEEWKTRSNPWLGASYSVRQMRGKDQCKAALQAIMGLPPRPDAPLFVTVSRLADQKGIDILVAALEQMLPEHDIQFALLGNGQREWVLALTDLAARFPGKVSVKIGYDHGLAHQMEAGADFFLMPSQFEPCGLNQMYSLRYGTIPIVRATGGLDDSVQDIRDEPEAADGIKFHEYSAAALVRAMQKALVLFEHPSLLKWYRRNGMAADFSWKRTARDYVAVYQEMIARSEFKS
jgi:starch synthase